MDEKEAEARPVMGTIFFSYNATINIRYKLLGAYMNNERSNNNS